MSKNFNLRKRILSFIFAPVFFTSSYHSYGMIPVKKTNTEQMETIDLSLYLYKLIKDPNCSANDDPEMSRMLIELTREPTYKRKATRYERTDQLEKYGRKNYPLPSERPLNASIKRLTEEESKQYFEDGYIPPASALYALYLPNYGFALDHCTTDMTDDHLEETLLVWSRGINPPSPETFGCVKRGLHEGLTLFLYDHHMYSAIPKGLLNYDEEKKKHFIIFARLEDGEIQVVKGKSLKKLYLADYSGDNEVPRRLIFTTNPKPIPPKYKSKIKKYCVKLGLPIFRLDESYVNDLRLYEKENK